MMDLGGFILFIILSLIGVIILIYVYPLCFMRPTQTGKIVGTEVIAIKNLLSNLFLIKITSGYILVDAGLNRYLLKKSLRQLSIEPKEIKYILLTHTDFDHVGALKLFIDAQIMINTEEIQMINGMTKRSIFTNNSLSDEINADNLVELENGKKLDIDGHRIECISTPGHTMGSMMYLIDEKYLFTGDVFKVNENRIRVHPYSMNRKLANTTIKLLPVVLNRCRLVVTAHYGYHHPERFL